MDKPSKQGQPWDAQEERSLYDAFCAGDPIKSIAASHKRTEGAIRSHLRLMGLVDSFGSTIEPPPPFAITAPVLNRIRKQTTKESGDISPAKHRMTEKEISTVDLNPQFRGTLHIMENTKTSLFITGRAGTGKSTLLSTFCSRTDKAPVVLAPTGVAALNVKGQTIHSFFNFYIDTTPQKIRDKKTKPRNVKLYRQLKTIVIDEISMVRADLLDCIDAFLRLYGPRQGRAFGGVQMIFIGDLYQLPPVINAQERDLFNSLYETPYFFSAHVLKEYPLEFIELEKVYRQKDAEFIDILNQIRTNVVGVDTLNRLNERHKPWQKSPEGSFFITLTSTNKRADEVNEEHLSALPGKIYSSEAVISGVFTKDYYPTAPVLQFKIDAQVMMLNNDAHKRWVNGSIGVIRSIKQDIDNNDYLEIELVDSGRIVDVSPYIWEVYRFSVENESIISEPVGTFTQFPFRLAWAVTIHKSQGKTFEHVSIDIGQRTFAAGQLYVALSRATSLDGIILKTPIARHHIRTDHRIFNFLASIMEKSALPQANDKIGQIKQAIKDHKVIEIIYLKGDSTKTTRLIRPIKIGQEVYKGHNFLGLQAHCLLHDEQRTFTVERILSIKSVQPA